jgi:hypothetical protein
LKKGPTMRNARPGWKQARLHQCGQQFFVELNHSGQAYEIVEADKVAAISGSRVWFRQVGDAFEIEQRD